MCLPRDCNLQSITSNERLCIKCGHGHGLDSIQYWQINLPKFGFKAVMRICCIALRSPPRKLELDLKGSPCAVLHALNKHNLFKGLAHGLSWALFRVWNLNLQPENIEMNIPFYTAHMESV